MKAKSIQKIINQRFNAWVKSITDENVKRLVQENTIMTGGAIVSMLLNEPVNDFDFYFRNKETTFAVAKYYVDQFVKENPNHKSGHDVTYNNDGLSVFVPIEVRLENDGRVHVVAKSAGIAAAGNNNTYRYFELDPRHGASDYIDDLVDAANQMKKNEKMSFAPIFLSSNAITLTNDVQIVIRFYGDPEKIHENYDFIHCTNYWTSWNNEVVLNAKALESILTRELIYVGSKYPIASLCRIRKFLDRGWYITAGQILKISMQISELNLNNFDILEDQLTGVDAAYFMDIIAKLKEKDAQAIDKSYLGKLIDEIF